MPHSAVCPLLSPPLTRRPQAATAKALEQAEGIHPEPAQLWWRFERLKGDAVWRALPTRGQRLDFSDEGDDPWAKHLVQVG